MFVQRQGKGSLIRKFIPDLLIVLPHEGDGPDLQPGHVCGLVEDVEVVVGRHPEHRALS